MLPSLAVQLRRERSFHMPPPVRPIEERFLEKIDKTSSPHGCWIWTSCKEREGYGCMQILTHGKRKWKRAHRIAWCLYRGPIPDGMEVIHNCPGGDNKACCNPDHLLLATRKEHAEDTKAKGQYLHLSGTANGRSKLNPNKIREARRLRNLGYSFRMITEQIGCVTAGTIQRALSGKTWRGVK